MLTRKHAIRFCGAAAVVGLSTVSMAANAVIDVTAVTTGITDASVALVALIGALMALSVGIFGISKVYGFIKRKAGA